MSQIQKIQQIYQAFGRGDVPGLLEHLAENVAWEPDAVDHGIPWLVPGRGKQHVVAFLQVVAKELDISKFEVKSLLDGQQQVVAIIEIEATIRSTGKKLRDLELHLWTLGGSGQVEKFRHIVDTHSHWLASRP